MNGKAGLVDLPENFEVFSLNTKPERKKRTSKIIQNLRFDRSRSQFQQVKSRRSAGIA